MDIRKLIKGLLFIFVVLSLGVLIHKELSSKNESNAVYTTVTKVDIVAISGKSVPVPESQTAREAVTKQKGKTPSPQAEMKSRNSKVIAYYFHGTFRCATCRTIEKYSKEAIEKYFAAELKNGTLEFKPINVNEADTRHFIQDYQLVTRSLVLSLNKDGKETRWTILKEVWTYVSDKERFFQYVKDEVEKYLKET